MKKTLTLLFFSWQLTGLQAQCINPLEDATFSQIHAGVANIIDGQDATIKDITANNCLTSPQVGLFAELYNSDNERYSYLLFAKPYVSDPQQYSTLATLLKDTGLQQQFRNHINPPAVNSPTTHTNTVNNSSSPLQTMVANDIDEPQIVFVEGYDGRLGCEMPVFESVVDEWVSEIKEESFDNKRLELFKRKAAGYCLKVTQIHRILKIFDFDNNQIQFAKIALAHCYDIDNYLLLTDAFSYPSSKKEITDHFNTNAKKYVWKENYTKNVGAVTGNSYNGDKNCAFPMSSSEFEAILRAAKNQSFDNARTEDIRNAVGSRCLSVAQTKQLVKIYSFDNYKLDFVKYAYKHTYDVANFLQLEQLFSYESDKKKLRALVK